MRHFCAPICALGRTLNSRRKAGFSSRLNLDLMRLRLASALPALIGARTVALLRQAGPLALTRRVKMPRHEMRGLMGRIALGLASPAVLDKQFRRLSGDTRL